MNGLVDLEKLTPESDKHLPRDHGLANIFQPVAGSWHQILGVFASRENVKAALMSKILLKQCWWQRKLR